MKLSKNKKGTTKAMLLIKMLQQVISNICLRRILPLYKLPRYYSTD